MIASHYPLVIIGAGPAGMAAAIKAASNNLQVAVFDEAPAPGGQIYRGVENSQFDQSVMGQEYFVGQNLVESFRMAKIDYFPSSSVWNIGKDKRLGVLYQKKNYIVTADCLILATGAMERPVPFNGWTLPGVMHAGAGQIMLKQGGLSPDGKMVLAGSGPLLLLLASQYLKAGKKIEAIIDTTPRKNFLKAIPLFFKALLASSYLFKGLGLLFDIRRSGIKYYKYAEQLEVSGQDQLQNVSFISSGQQHTLEVDWLLTHFGVIPNQALSSAIGCEQVWDESQYCWRPKLDEHFNSSVDGIKIVGDGNGIGGAKSAEMEGELAALDVLLQLDVLSPEEYENIAVPLTSRWKKDLSIRPFLEAFYKVDCNHITALPDNALICRCEEVSRADIDQAVKDGAKGVNQLKAFTRCGMGPCQGKQCGLSVAQLIASKTHQHISEVGYFRPRMPLKSLTLGELAAIDIGNCSEQTLTISKLEK